MATHSPESVLWVLLQSGSSTVSPGRGSSDVVCHGVSVFHVLHTAAQQCRPSPCLSLSLFLIIELNGIKSFSTGILFFCIRPFEQPEGDFNMLLPFDTVRVLEVGELRGI